jgi:DNA-binding IclR family transcriptional regulator
MARREKTNYIIQSVSHALDVLEQFSGDAAELGVTELSKRLKLHKNNVFRLLATLESRGYIEQNKATDNYRLGIRCLGLGQRFVTQVGFLRQARPAMSEVSAATGETAFIAVMRNATVVPLDAIEADQPVRLVSAIGTALPLHGTAAGKVHLAFGDEAVRNGLPESLQKFTEKTLVDPQALAQQLKKVSENGYAVDVGEHIEDVRSVAVPIRDYAHALVGSLAIAGPSYRMSQERIEKELAPLVVKAGRELSTRLGFENDGEK